MRKSILSIRLKLFIAFVFVGVLASVFVGVQSFKGTKRIIEQNQERTLTAIVNIKSQKISNLIDTMKSDFLFLSINPEIIRATEAFSEAFGEKQTAFGPLLNQCRKRLEIYYDEVIAPQLNLLYDEDSSSNNFAKTTQGLLLQCKYIANVNNPETAIPISLPKYENAQLKFSNFLQNSQRQLNYKDLLIVDMDGFVVYSNVHNIDFGTNLYTGPWARTALAAAYRDVAINGLNTPVNIYDYSFYLPSFLEPTAFIAAAVTNGDNMLGDTMVGVLIATMGAEQFDSILTSKDTWEIEGLGSTGESYLVGADKLMRSNSKFLSSKSIDSGYLESLKDAGYSRENIDLIKSNKSTILLQQIDTTASNALLTGDTGVVSGKGYLGGNVLSAYSPLDLDGLNWGIIVEISDKEVKKPVNALLAETMKLMLAILALVLLLTAIISGNMIRPISKLRNAVQSFSTGVYSNRIESNSDDEMGELADAFNHMADTIEQRSLELTKLNKSLVSEVADRKNIEYNLQKERDFIAAVLNSQVIMLLITDEDKRVVQMNRHLESIAGSYFRVVPDNLFQGVDYRKIADDAARGKPQMFESNFQSDADRRAGSDKKRVITWSVSSLASEDTSDYLVWTGIDVTEKSEVEEQLKESAKMLESLTSSAQDAIMISDENDEIILWNESAEHMFGYTNAEILGEKVIPTIVPEFYLSVLENSDATFDAKSGSTFEAEGIRKDGDLFSIEMSVSLVKSKGKRNTLHVVRDASLRKKRELELKEALDKARVAEKAKTDFVANMSHEIRTPLNGVIGFLDLLKTTPLNQVQEYYLNIILMSADSLLRVINDILDFSKIESGKLTIEEIEFDTFGEIEQAIDIFQAKADEKSIHLSLDMDPYIPRKVFGDALRIRQIITNLISNAIKFTPEGGSVSLMVHLLEKSPDRCKISIMVADTGIGISKDKQDNIFEAFSQADNSVTRKYGGTGLGLSICLQLAKLMGGSLFINSEEGKGSIFGFDLELKMVLPEEQLPDMSGVAVAIIGGESSGNEQLSKYLSALGCNTHIIGSVKDLDKIADVKIILADTDFTSANCFAQMTKVIPESSIIVVAHDHDDVEKYTDIGHSPVLLKPIKFTRVMKVMGDIISGHKNIVEVAEDVRKIYSGKVLVAEDNLVNQQLINILLSGLGLTIEIANNGKEAFDKALLNRYDIIFMDIHMPIMDGVTFTENYLRHCRSVSLLPPPIVALTANVISEDRDLYLDAGMSDFLAKPIDMKLLTAVLDKYL